MTFDDAPFIALIYRDDPLTEDERDSLEYLHSASNVSNGIIDRWPSNLWCQDAAEIDRALVEADDLPWSEASAVRGRAVQWIANQHGEPLNTYQRARIEAMLQRL